MEPPTDAPPSDEQVRFDALIDADERIEPTDWMPDEYRKTLVRQIAQHAHSEVIGHAAGGQLAHPRPVAAPQGDPDRQGPGRSRPRPLPLRRRRDARHASRGTPRSMLHTGRQKYSSIFNYPTLTWADVGAIGWLVDGAAIMNQVPLCRCSYGPYARAMIRICKEESFHQRQGFQIMLTLAKGTRRAEGDGAGRPRPLVVAVDHDVRPARRRIGPRRPEHAPGASSGSATTSSARSSSTQTVPQADLLGLTIPDPDLSYDDETGHYVHGPIDWDEFWDRRQGQRTLPAATRIAHPAWAPTRGRVGARRRRHGLRREAGHPRRSRRGGGVSASSGLAALGGVRPCEARGQPRARRNRPRPRRRARAPERPRPVHPSLRRRVSLWVVKSSDITASDPDDREARWFDPADDKTFRHPTDFELPDEVGHM